MRSPHSSPGAGSGPNSCEVYDRAVSLVPRGCVRVGAGSGRVLSHVRCITVRSCMSQEGV